MLLAKRNGASWRLALPVTRYASPVTDYGLRSTDHDYTAGGGLMCPLRPSGLNPVSQGPGHVEQRMHYEAGDKAPRLPAKVAR